MEAGHRPISTNRGSKVIVPVTATRVDGSRLLQGKIHNENIFNRNNGYHICLGSGRNIIVVSSGEGSSDTGGLVCDQDEGTYFADDETMQVSHVGVCPQRRHEDSQIKPSRNKINIKWSENRDGVRW